MSRPSPAEFFAHPVLPRQRRHEILRAFFHERLSAEAVARRFEIAPTTVYTMTRDFRRRDDFGADIFRMPH